MCSGFPRSSLIWPLSTMCSHTASGWHSCFLSAFNARRPFIWTSPRRRRWLVLRSVLYQKCVLQTPEAHYGRDQWGPRLAGGAADASLLLQDWPCFVEQMQLNASEVTVPRPSLHATRMEMSFENADTLLTLLSGAFGCFTGLWMLRVFRNHKRICASCTHPGVQC